MKISHWTDYISPSGAFNGVYLCTITDGTIEVTARGMTREKAYQSAVEKLTEKKMAKAR